jgi:hypothetical protein
VSTSNVTSAAKHAEREQCCYCLLTKFPSYEMLLLTKTFAERSIIFSVNTCGQKTISNETTNPRVVCTGWATISYLALSTYASPMPVTIYNLLGIVEKVTQAAKTIISPENDTTTTRMCPEEI